MSSGSTPDRPMPSGEVREKRTSNQDGGLVGKARSLWDRSIYGRIIARVRGAQGRGESGITELLQEDMRPAHVGTVEKHQAFKTGRSPESTTMELSSTIRERLHVDRELRQQLLTNPYTPEAREIFEREFGQPLTRDALRALVLAEPRDVYDQNFSRLDTKGREASLYEQLDISADMTMSLGQLVLDKGQEFFSLSDAELFTLLSRTAFDTDDFAKIGKEFSQSQRRGFNLSIVNFIEGMHTLQPYGEEFTTQLQDALIKYDIFDKPLAHLSDASVELTPVGIVVYLDHDDYAKMAHEEDSQSAKSAGRTHFNKNLPPELRGRIIFIDKGTAKEPTGPENLQSTRKHELLHAAYVSFFERGERHEYKADEVNPQTYDEYLQYGYSLQDKFFQIASDEVIAYASRYSSLYFQNDLSALGGNAYETAMQSLRARLMNKADQLTPEQKEILYQTAENARITYMQQVAEYQWVVEKLFEKAGRYDSDISAEKVIALLQNTRPDRIARLGAYFGIPPEQVHAEYLKDRAKTLQDFGRDVDKLIAVEQPDAEPERGIGLIIRPSGRTPKGEIPEEADRVIGILRLNRALSFYPVEAIPTLMKIITGVNNPDYVIQAMEAMKNIAVTQIRNLPRETITQMRQVIDQMEEKRTGDEFKGARNEASEIGRILAWAKPSKTLSEAGPNYLLPDFVGGAALKSKLRSIVGETPSYQYTPEQEIALANALTPQEMADLRFSVTRRSLSALPVMVTIMEKISSLNTQEIDHIVGVEFHFIQLLVSEYARYISQSPDELALVNRAIQIMENWDPTDGPEALRKGLKGLREKDIAEMRARLAGKPL